METSRIALPAAKAPIDHAEALTASPRIDRAATPPTPAWVIPPP
jgi:hypothetical protein